MRSFRSSLCRFIASSLPRLILFLMAAGILLSGAIAHGLPLVQEASQPAQSATTQRPAAAAQEEGQQSDEQSEPAAIIDKAVFQNPIPADQLTFLKQFEGMPADKLIRDKQFRKLMRSFVPDCMFHYGHDMPLAEALDTVFKGSSLPVKIHDGRYLVVAGPMGPYLAGKGFMWIDMQEGIALGGFYFHPTNGEPTPAVNVFSKQLKDEFLSMGQLPAAFAEELTEWSAESRVPAVTTRYFISGVNQKILLEHDEDYCNAPDGGARGRDCQQMNADAADFDVNAAYYLDQTHHATNATAWMISQDQIAWTRVRDNTCRIGVDPLLCRIRITREHVHVVIGIHRVRRPPIHVTRK
ncbi:MAG TPA: hypothetical protein VGK22_15575 [Candidatus Angelobacter sp.]